MENDEPDEVLSPAERAFDEAGRGFELFGNPLNGYSPDRVVAAQKMGMLYPFIGEKAAEVLEETGMYPGALEHCIIVLWLCSLPDTGKGKEWYPARANREHKTAQLVATGWAAKQGFVNMSSPKFSEAFQTFMAIVTGQEASKFKLSSGEQQTEIEPGKI